jgi:hypothetical protein
MIKIEGYVPILRRVNPKNRLKFITHDFNRGLSGFKDTREPFQRFEFGFGNNGFG